MTIYNWVISGLDGEGYSWHTSGVVDADDINTALTNARRDSFMQLTQGNAKYGKPGLGCTGPYTITSFALVQDFTCRE